ncbi:helix-turn-helix transcriptional regulator [Saccharomonospora iraqiensis]|uniref:helix-turn-helix transcriptional regulator n=1 Tax=Saccharomonospora iraqiensis TaxID=52698 RepID=UPI00022E1CEE|nr:helix-turn-helix transcriptional regulator [Saccharomonospora iraqiensis]
MARLPEPLAELRRELGRALAGYRESTGINQTELGRRTGYTRSSIAHIEKARQFPDRRFWAAADRVHRADGALLARYDTVVAAEARWRELDELRQDETARRCAHGTDVTGADVVADTEKEDDVNRRTLLALLGPAALGGPMLENLEQARRGLDGVLGVPAADRDADEWEQVAADYARQVQFQPPSRTRPALTADFADLRERIATAHEPARTRLVHSAAQLAALTAFTFVFLREHLAAQRWWRTAGRAAATVGDPRLSARIGGKQAIMSLYNATPERVLTLADRAIALGESKPSPGVLSGWSARTQALARIGRDDDARAAVDRLTELYERLPEQDRGENTSVWRWTSQQLYFVRSEVYSLGGRVDRAFEAQDAVLPLYAPDSFQGPAQIETHRARALIQSGEVEDGVAHLTATLDALDDWQRADGLVHRTAVDTLDAVPADEQRKPYVTDARTLLTPTPA